MQVPLCLKSLSTIKCWAYTRPTALNNNPYLLFIFVVFDNFKNKLENQYFYRLTNILDSEHSE